mgnify:FL=1
MFQMVLNGFLFGIGLLLAYVFLRLFVEMACYVLASPQEKEIMLQAARWRRLFGG